MVLAQYAWDGHANSIPDVCERNHSVALELLREPENRLAFENRGGFLGQGVCWWHSRFERAAAYLAEFRPDLSKPSRSEARRICNRLSHLKITMIPGYRNLGEFSEDYSDLIQKELNQWQIRDGLLNQAWRRGLAGKTRLSAAKLKTRVEKIITSFKKNPRPLFIKLQYPGITAHSHLLLNVHEANTGDPLFEVADSNRPQITMYERYSDGFSIPYIEYNRDFKTISKRTLRYCQE